MSLVSRVQFSYGYLRLLGTRHLLYLGSMILRIYQCNITNVIFDEFMGNFSHTHILKCVICVAKPGVGIRR